MSELRQDPVSGDWIILAPERAKRPHLLLSKRRARRGAPKSSCPFENLKKTGNWPPIVAVPSEEKWRVAVIPNKFPALTHGEYCPPLVREGPYSHYEGIGHHDLVVTRDHRKNLGDLSARAGAELFEAIQRRYRMLLPHQCLAYTLTFFNWGAAAGASVYHPHYQMLTLPIIPPDVQHSLDGSQAFWKRHHQCVHCAMLAADRRHKGRIVEENRGAIAVTPYVSRQPFEIRVYPKRHLPYFERTGRADLEAFVRVLGSCIRRMRRYLRDPDFNFFLHTAPLKRQENYRHYHWHVEILPKISIPAGFELGTGVEIDIVDPDRAAGILRGAR